MNNFIRELVISLVEEITMDNIEIHDLNLIIVSNIQFRFNRDESR